MRPRFSPKATASCSRCGGAFTPNKLGLCPECGGRFCGDHILDHKCPDPEAI